MVYLIVVYDFEAERTRLPRKFLRQHLEHIQNSVFEGEVTEANAEKIKNKLQEMASESESVIIYESWSEKYVDRKAIGIDPKRDDRLL